MTAAVDRAEQVHPAASDAHEGFIHAPGGGLSLDLAYYPVAACEAAAVRPQEASTHSAKTNKNRQNQLARSTPKTKTEKRAASKALQQKQSLKARIAYDPKNNLQAPSQGLSESEDTAQIVVCDAPFGTSCAQRTGVGR